MSDGSEVNSYEDEDVLSDTVPPSSSKTIVIPTAHNSDSEKDFSTSFRSRKVSSSEESDGDEILQEFNSKSFSFHPTHLLKRARRQARLFMKKGELESSVKERVRCLAYTRLVFGDGSWQLAKAYGKLGEAYLKRKGFCKQALLHASRGRDELLHGESNEFRSNRQAHSNDVLGVMALVYFVMGKANFLSGEFRKAEQAFSKAEISGAKRLKIDEAQVSEMYVKILESLGQVCAKLKKYDISVEYCEKGLKYARKIYGKSGKELIPLYLELGKAYQRQQGDFNKRKCEEVFEKCYKLADENFDEGSIELADVLYSTTVSYQKVEHDLGKTQKHFEKCLEIYKDQCGSDHKKTIKIQEELCQLHLRNGKYEEAASITREVVTNKMMVYGEPSVSLAESYQLLGTIRLSQGKTDKTVQHLGKSRSMFSCVLGKNHPKTVQVTETLNMVKKTPLASKFQSPEEKLKERPRFNGTVGRSTALGMSTAFANI